MGSASFSFQTFRPFFDGSDYPHWKHRMKFYLDSDSIRLWDVIIDGWKPPIKMVDGIQVLKERNEWSQEEKEENHKNKRSTLVLIASMSRKEGGKL